MTDEEKRKVLKEYLQLNRDINKKIQQEGELRDACLRITPALSGMPPATSDRNELYAKWLDAQREIDQMTDKFATQKHVIAENAVFMATNDQRILLRERYYNLKTWFEIAVMLKKSVNYVRHELHDAIINKIQYLV